jgi:hypothetical protein
MSQRVVTDDGTNLSRQLQDTTSNNGDHQKEAPSAISPATTDYLDVIAESPALLRIARPCPKLPDFITDRRLSLQIASCYCKSPLIITNRPALSSRLCELAGY